MGTTDPKKIAAVVKQYKEEAYQSRRYASACTSARTRYTDTCSAFICVKRRRAEACAHTWQEKGNHSMQFLYRTGCGDFLRHPVLSTIFFGALLIFFYALHIPIRGTVFLVSALLF